MPFVRSAQPALLYELQPYGSNPRRHSKGQIKKLARSIERFGFTSPIVVDEDNVVLAGHGRLEAAKLLGLREVPVVRIEGLSAAEKSALRIADNRIADESKFDKKLLSVELQSILELDLDLAITGLDAIELDPLLRTGEDAAGEPEPLLSAVPKVPVSKLGDLWQLGDHKLFCADAQDPLAYKRLLGDDRAAMVFTDPPWNVRIDGHVSERGKAKHAEFQMASGEMSEVEFRSFLTTVLTNIHTSAGEGSLHYICMDWRHIADLLGAGTPIFSRLMNVVVWAKPNGGMGSFYRSQHELIVIFKRGTQPHINNIQLGKRGRYRSNVWQYPGGSSFSTTRKQDLEDHPTVKPVAMVADAILDASKPGDLILDPFGGSGTTLLAAQKTKRRAALMEIEPRFADVILRRFSEMTGVEPVLLPEALPFTQVRQMRNQEEGASDER